MNGSERRNKAEISPGFINDLPLCSRNMENRCNRIDEYRLPGHPVIDDDEELEI